MSGRSWRCTGASTTFARTADWLDQEVGAIETALRYYEAHRSEIDEWIRRNEEAAEAAERVARAQQAAS